MMGGPVVVEVVGVVGGWHVGVWLPRVGGVGWVVVVVHGVFWGKIRGKGWRCQGQGVLES